jgi:hypothetical protein
MSGEKLVDLTMLSLFFIFGITLHNVEEALWLPKWSARSSRFQKPVGENEFRFAVLIITMLAYLATGLFVLAPNVLVFKCVFLGFVGAMAINVLVVHLASTVILRKYSPGLATGLFFMLPFNLIILANAVQSSIAGVLEIILSTIIMAILLVALIPILFTAGKILINYG